MFCNVSIAHLVYIMLDSAWQVISGFSGINLPRSSRNDNFAFSRRQHLNVIPVISDILQFLYSIFSLVAGLYKCCSYLRHISMAGILMVVYSMLYYVATEVACQFLIILATTILFLAYSCHGHLFRLGT